MLLPVEEDRGAAAPHLLHANERPAVPAHAPLDLPQQRQQQQQQQQEHQLGVAVEAPMQTHNRADQDTLTQHNMPDRSYPAAAQHAQQHIKTAMPSSLGWGLFPAPAQAAMPFSRDTSVNQHLHAYPDEGQQPPCSTDLMPARAVPDNATWMQLYTAAHAAQVAWVQSQGRLWQPSGQGNLFQPQPPHADDSSALPPALAQQDPATGQWVPTLIPMNPYVIDQMAKTEISFRQGISMQGQPSSDSLHASAYPDGMCAVASKKRKRASKQPNAQCLGKAPAVDQHACESMQEDSRAQLADQKDMARLAPTMNKTVRMPQLLDDSAMSSMHQQQGSVSHLQWHQQAQADGISPQLWHQQQQAGGSNPQLWHQQAQADGICPQLWHQQQQAGGSIPQLWHQQAQADGHRVFAPTHAQQPTGQDDVINLCSPASSSSQHYQQDGDGCGVQASGTAQMWQHDIIVRAAAAPDHQQAKSRLHKELADFAVLAMATQVHSLVYMRIIALML